MSQSHCIKGRTTYEAFNEQFFVQEWGASIGADFDLYNFEDIWHEQDPI